MRVFFLPLPASSGSGHGIESWLVLVGKGCALFVSYFFRVKAVLICCWLDEVEAGSGKVRSSNTTSPHQETGAPKHDAFTPPATSPPIVSTV